MSIRYYSNVATPTALSAGINNTTDVVVPVNSTVNFPTQVPWLATIDRGLSTQEVVMVVATPTSYMSPATNNSSANTFRVLRAQDGTSLKSHTTGAIFEHTSAAMDYREPNTFINTYTSAGDLVVGISGGYQRLALGSQGTILTSSGGTAAWSSAAAVQGAQGNQGIAGPVTIPPYIFAVPTATQTFTGGGTLNSIPLTRQSGYLGGSNAPYISGNLVKFPQAGVYSVSASIGLVGTPGNTNNYLTACLAFLQSDGGTDVTFEGSTARWQAGNGGGTISSVSAIMSLAAGGSVKLRALTWDDGTVHGVLNYGQSSPFQTYLTATYIAPNA